MKKVIYLDYKANNITGGHKYNTEFRKYFAEKCNIKIEFRQSLSTKYSGIKKIFSPILELIELKFLSKETIVFFSDTAYKYHFILLFFASIYSKAHTIIIVHHFPYLENPSRINKFLQQKYYSMANSVIVPSPFTLDVAKTFIDREKLHYIPIPFDKKMKISKDYQTGNLLYVGTIEKRKGIMYMLKAIKTLKSHLFRKLDIVGKIVDVNYYNELSELVKTNGLEDRVTFHGRVSYEELDNFYKKAEIFVFPSMLEGYGIVLIEAMKYGLPIVAFGNSAIPYTVKNEINGLLVENKDSKAMSMAIDRLVGNVELRSLLQSGIVNTVNELNGVRDFQSAIDKFLTTL